MPHWAHGRKLSSIVLAIIVALSAGAFLVARNTVRDSERRLLNERAAAVNQVLTAGFEQMTSELTVLGMIASDPDVAASTAQRLYATGAKQGILAIGAAGPGSSASGFVTLAAAGRGATPVGKPVASGLERLLDAAVRAHDTVAELSGSGMPMVIMAQPEGPVVAWYAMLLPGNQPLPQAQNPFRELEGALYFGDSTDPANLLIRTGMDVQHAPGTQRSKLTIGASTYTLVTKSTRPLVGEWTTRMPWLVLAAGLIMAFTVSMALNTLVRRREYAREQVRQATAELEQSNAELTCAVAAAEAANRSKSEFVSRMSHELRTPLNAVLGYGQLLQMDELNEYQAKAVDQILSGGRHLLDLINEVLDISRMETGRLELDTDDLQAADLVADVVGMARPLAAAENVSIADEMRVECAVRADAKRTRQILLNLLTNAVKYNRPGGSVTVRCEADGDRIRIDVIDTGIGIAADDIERAFEPFERLGAKNSEVEGTGIGLWLSRRLAEAMGGTLTCVSDAGRGTTMTLVLPRAGCPGRTLQIEKLTAEEPRLPNRTTVLCVDDHQPNRKLLEMLFTRHEDFDLVTVETGTEGLERARTLIPALILLDLHLPDISGSEVLARLRTDPLTAHIPVVILSADATPSQIQRLETEGANAYLTKPIDLDALMGVVHEYAGAAS